MNQASEVYKLNYLVYQKGWVWYVQTPKQVSEFKDNIIVDKITGEILYNLP
jgi:hypothetical protein